VGGTGVAEGSAVAVGSAVGSAWQLARKLAQRIAVRMKSVFLERIISPWELLLIHHPALFCRLALL
jgi:hypothetical protein